MTEEKIELVEEKLGSEALNFSDAEKNDVGESTQQKTQSGEISISSERAEERLEEIISSQKPQNRKRSTIVSLILLLVNIIFMVFIVSGLIENIGEQSLIDYIKSQGNRLWWLAGGIGCYILYMFSQTIMFRTIIKDLTGKSQWRLSYDVGITGKYYDNVTPFAVGGQPMQILQLAKTGISPGVSTFIPLIKMIINSMTSAVLGVFFFVFGISRIVPTNSLYALLFVVFEILGIIGLIITIFTVILMMMLSTGSLFTRSLIAWIVKVGYKLKLVKNYRATLKKWLDQVGEYKASMIYLKKKKFLLFKMVLYSCLESLSYAGISFFVVMAFMEPGYLELNQISIWYVLFTCVVKYYICSMAGSYIPLPGATGLMEIAFIALYGEFVGDAIVWALLTWRIISYYLILLHGFVHEMIKIIRNISKTRKMKQSQVDDVRG